MIKQTIAVEHIRIESAKSFADVHAALKRSVPHLDPSLVKALDDGDVERAYREKKEGPELSIFQVRDHGALLKIAGRACNALRYDIGNPVTASLMTRHRLSARSMLRSGWCSTRAVLGTASSEYDQPSTTFGQFGDERVTVVARGLDAALERALLGAVVQSLTLLSPARARLRTDADGEFHFQEHVDIATKGAKPRPLWPTPAKKPAFRRHAASPKIM